MTLAYAIIPAAGQGRRFGTTKQFQLLEGKPVYLHTLEVFEASPLIQGILLVVPPSEVEAVQMLLGKTSFKKVRKVLPGGKERQDSVRKGFEATPFCDVIVVHDGVRPFVTVPMIEQSIVAAQEFGGSVVGLPVKETTKKVTEDLLVQETVDRSNLWSIQTPQAFRYEILQRAIQKADKDQFIGTDEAMLVERLRERLEIKIKLIEGSPTNIKITTPEDLTIASAIVKARKIM